MKHSLHEMDAIHLKSLGRNPATLVVGLGETNFESVNATLVKSSLLVSR